MHVTHHPELIQGCLMQQLPAHHRAGIGETQSIPCLSPGVIEDRLSFDQSLGSAMRRPYLRF